MGKFKTNYNRVYRYLYKHNKLRLVLETLSIVLAAIPISILYPHIQYFGNFLITRRYNWQQKIWYLSKHWNESWKGILLMVGILAIFLAIFLLVQSIGKHGDKNEETKRHKELIEKLDEISKKL